MTTTTESVATPRRLPGAGILVLLGGGEFSFGETLDADRAWGAKPAPGPVGFIPAASGSADYGHHFAEYMEADLRAADGDHPDLPPARRPAGAQR